MNIITTRKASMSVQNCTMCLVVVYTFVILAGLDVSHATTTKPKTGTNNVMISNGSSSGQGDNPTLPSDAETDNFLKPKNCTRIKMTSATFQGSYIGSCVSQKKTCTSFLIFWKKCRQKDVTTTCLKYQIKTKTVTSMEATCCEGFVPYNDTAAFCIKGCETGKYGENCTLDCNCTGNTRPDCDLTSGQCKCTEGWTGPNCTDVCDEGFYGYKCENTCPCENNSTCNHVNGTCNCTSPGWTGDTCNTVCPEGQYGYYCEQKCSCPTNATCDPRTGECQCIAGLTGVNCTEVCDDEHFGVDCQQKCTCVANNTRACDAITGKCYCTAGWTDRDCSEYCEPGTYGVNCQKLCNCTDAEACHPVNGECISRFLCSVNGTSNCDPSLGKNDCTGIRRNTSLELLQGPIRVILRNPEDICDSVNNQTEFCSPSNNSVLCECFDGRTGYSCEKLCPSGAYGKGCGKKCDCDDGAKCDRVDGRCLDAGKSVKQTSDQNATNMGLVFGTVIPSVFVIIVIVGVALYKGRVFSNIKNST
ncbi:multiple epidermal growth factor-like domains protein 11, partial [Ylistrum balloti]|uniref:multiple epidermal growth factor-like domains protein 11 n=1 Tax=Ylistrum balloti TaxID=509963 RepID=UPI0029058F63